MSLVQRAVSYLTNLGTAAVGGKPEGFSDGSQQPQSVTVASEAVVGLTFMWILAVAVFVFVNAAGAARMSWCYNSFIGTPDGLKLVYAVLAFMFCGLYYPFYAVFLNPVCAIKRLNK